MTTLEVIVGLYKTMTSVSHQINIIINLPLNITYVNWNDSCLL